MTTEHILDIVTLAIENNPQTLAAVKEIVAREWGDPGADLDREWRIGEAVTNELHLSIGHPGGEDNPDAVRWEYTILLNLIYHIPDYALGRYCMREFRPESANRGWVQ